MRDDPDRLAAFQMNFLGLAVSEASQRWSAAYTYSEESTASLSDGERVPLLGNLGRRRLRFTADQRAVQRTYNIILQ